MKNKRFLALMFALLLAFSMTACGNKATNTEPVEEVQTDEVEIEDTETSETITTGELSVSLEEHSGAICFDISPDDFEALGFELGDSVNFELSNGSILEDVPYVDSFIARTGDPLVVNYSGFPTVFITRCNGNSLWEEFNATEDDTAVVTLNEKGKYLTTVQVADLVYSVERDDYESDEQFSNFRVITGGNLKADTFYRSSSPFNMEYNRAPITNSLVEAAGIRYEIDMNEDAESIAEIFATEDFSSDYAKALYEAGNVATLDLNNNYYSEKFATAISGALLEMTKHEGPYLINCVEGKDRTGFVCELILALAGASAEEITVDFMKSYENYYGITEADVAYEVIVNMRVNDALEYFAGAERGADVSELSFVDGAKEYLKLGGLTDEEVESVVTFLTK